MHEHDVPQFTLDGVLPGRGVPCARPQFRHRTRLHQPAERSGSCGHSLARGRSAQARPDCAGRWARRVQPRAGRRLPRYAVLGDGEEIPTADLRGDPEWKFEGRPGWPRQSAAAAGRRRRGLHSQSSTTSPICRTAGSSGCAEPGGRALSGRANTPAMDLDAWPYPKRPLVPLAENWRHERYSVEIFRGCNRGCRFCQAGMITRPVRNATSRIIGAMVQAGIEGDWSRRSACCRCPVLIIPRSVPSPTSSPIATRATYRCRCPALGWMRSTSTWPTSCPATAGAQAYLAPEGGSERMRKVINKIRSPRRT